MTDWEHDLDAGQRAERFRHEELALADALASLLGREARALSLVERPRAAALATEFLASHHAHELHGGVTEETWRQAQVQLAVDALHRASRNLGSRPVWLLVGLSDPHAVALASEIVLDNPLGFAALGDHELRVLDCELPAGLWLLRGTHQAEAETSDCTWELTAWGEPWASATTRALRGIG